MIWAAALLVLVLVGGVGVVVFTLTLPPAEATFVAVSPTSVSHPTDNRTHTDGWITVAVPEGATLFVPGPLKKQTVTTAGETGACHSAVEGDTTAEVLIFDIKGDRRPDREEFLGKVLGVGADRVSFSGVKPIPGGDAIEFSASDATGFDHAGLVIGRGGRWFVFHIRWKSEDDPKERSRSAFISRAGVAWVRPDVPADPPKPKDLKPPVPIKPKDAVPTSPKAKDPKTEAEPITEAWVAIDNKAGFTATAPKGVRAEKLFVNVNRMTLGGQKWQIDDTQCTYHLSYLDLPADFDLDLAKLVKPLIVFGHDLGASADGKVDGQKATLWELKHWDKPAAKAVTVQCGFRVFTAFVASKHGKRYADDATLAQRTDKFLGGLKFGFDPKADDPYAGEPKWAGIENTAGFAARVPTPTNSVKEHGVGFPTINGKVYRAEAGGIVYEVFVHDVPEKRTAGDVVKGLLGHDKLVSGPDEVKANDRKYTSYELGSPERPVLVRTTTVGRRVFTLRAHPEGHGDDRAGAREFRDKAAIFFDQFRVDE